MFEKLKGLTGAYKLGVAEEETERDRYGVRTLGEFCTVGNADPLPLGGIGLVVGLDGTGAAPTSDANRTMLEDDLRKQGVRNIKEMLASNTVALVMISASIPPGTRKGDALDIEVTLPPRSNKQFTVSLGCSI